MFHIDNILSYVFFLTAVERTQERKLEEELLGAARDGEAGKLSALVRFQVLVILQCQVAEAVMLSTNNVTSGLTF